MVVRLTEEEMECLAAHRARLDAELEVVSEKKAKLEEDIETLDSVLNVIDKIIDNSEVEYR